jgi:hypothetical protein
MEQNLVFVGGSARSGTTLVQNMLDSHPDVLGGPEFLHLPEIVRLRNSMQENVARGWIDKICSHEDVDARFHALILDFLLPFAARHDAKLLSEKTPENVRVFPELVELLPNSKFIMVVRDPRAIVSSMLQVGRRASKKGVKVQEFTRNVDAAINYIKRCMDAGFKAAANSPDHVLTVAYENVVRDPQAETKKICEFLEISWDAAMCSPGEKKHMGESAITVESGEIWYSADQYYANPHTAGLDKWKTTMSPWQVIKISKAFENYHELVKLDYDFNLTDMTQAERIWGLFLNNLYKLADKVVRVLQRVARSLKLCP